MNRIEGRIASGLDGVVESAAGNLPAEAARGHPDGQPVLLLIRPEAIELVNMADGRAIPDSAIQGRIVSRIFLGAVTRLSVATAVGDLNVDIASSTALSLPEKAEVGLSWQSHRPRLIALQDGVDGVTHSKLEQKKLGSATIPGASS
jgi:ABC-type Fe3+/spermidine/putrescine transport system ATPase subunit